MNGFMDMACEASDDEEFAIACGYEIISQQELSCCEFANSLPRHRGSTSSVPCCDNKKHGFKFSFMKNTASFVSRTLHLHGHGVTPPRMSKPMSSTSLSSQGTDMSDEDFSSHHQHHLSSGISECIHHDHHEEDDYEDDHQLSVEKLWYLIQQKRHNHDHDHVIEGDLHPHFLTMEHHSHNKLTEWFHSLLHLPEKLRQIAADKHRFNINNVPEEIRDELKHIYVY